MTKRWPNTPLWQRLEKTFRTTDGSRWRTAAAATLGVKRSEIRGLIDLDEHPDVEQIDKVLIDHLHQHVHDLRQRAADVDNLARAVMRARNEVSPHYLIEVPIKLDPVPPGYLRPSEPMTAWERVKWEAFGEFLEHA